MTSFPIGSSVLLQNLVKGAHLNEKKGIVKSRLSTTGRQEVYIFEENKSLSIKPTNLKYEPRTLSSLSIPEMKSILTNGIGSSNSIDFTGLDKDSLRTMVQDEIDNVDDTIEIAKLVAKANEPKNIPATSTMNGSGGSAGGQQFSSSQLRQGAERMSSMSADDIKRQAQTMKAMGPAALRNMNPQFASMSDEQINMAITQMEAVANNPSQLQMAAQQMKNMSESELDQAVKQTGFNGGDAAAGGSAPSSTTTAAATPNALPNISQSQMQQATNQLTNMTPEQLKQQAAMLKSMSYDQLRATNPQMANMSDSQIQMSIQQLEMMADNPAMVKMAADQMKNMNENDFENMRKSLDPNTMPAGQGSNGTTASGGNAPPPNLTSNMMTSLLTNPEQLNSIVKTMKASPDMLKSALGPMINGGSEAQQKQMNDAIDSFVRMDDAKLEKYLKLANGLQRVATPFVNTFGKVKDMTGLSAKTLFGLWNLMVFVSFVGAVRWWTSRNGGDDDVVGVDDVLSRSHEEVPDMSGVADEF